MLSESPGETKTADSDSIVSSHTLWHTFNLIDRPINGIRFKDTTGDWLTFALTPDGLEVRDISLLQSVSPPSNVIVLGDVIARFGIPDYVCFTGILGTDSWLFYI